MTPLTIKQGDTFPTDEPAQWLVALGDAVLVPILTHDEGLAEARKEAERIRATYNAKDRREVDRRRRKADND